MFHFFRNTRTRKAYADGPVDRRSRRRIAEIEDTKAAILRIVGKAAPLDETGIAALEAKCIATMLQYMGEPGSDSAELLLTKRKHASLNAGMIRIQPKHADQEWELMSAEAIDAKD